MYVCWALSVQWMLPVISCPQLCVCSSPVVFTYISPQGPRLTWFSLEGRFWTTGSCWGEIGQVLWNSSNSRGWAALLGLSGAVPGVWGSSGGWMAGSPSTDCGSNITLPRSSIFRESSAALTCSWWAPPRNFQFNVSFGEWGASSSCHLCIHIYPWIGQ